MADKSNTATVEEIASDEEDDLLPDDWNDLGTGEELAMMAIDELSFQMDIENDDDSIDTTNNVPFSALNALINLSFDAVLDT